MSGGRDETELLETRIKSLEDELKDSKALNKALTILAGEVSSMMD